MDEFVGRGLIELLRTKMGQDDLSLAQVGHRLKVGGSYLSQLSRGTKPLASVSEQFLRGCAEYLGIPVVLVYLLAGRLRAKDFFISPMTMEMRIDSSLEQIAKSKIGAETAVDAGMLIGLPYAAKFLVVLLYERAEGVRLLPQRVSTGEVEAVGQAYVPFELRMNKSE